jgi:hypothetical protein
MQRQSLAHTVVAQERALLPVAAVEVFGPRCRGCLAGRLCQRRSDRPATSLTTASPALFHPKTSPGLAITPHRIAVPKSLYEARGFFDSRKLTNHTNAAFNQATSGFIPLTEASETGT